MTFALQPDLAQLPRIHDPERAAVGRARLRDAVGDKPALAPFLAALDSGPIGVLFDGLLAHSPFLTQCLLRDVAFAERVVTEGPDTTYAALLQSLDAIPYDGALPALMKELRQTRARAALLIALADIAGAWPVERVTSALSELAEGALSAASRHVLHKAAQDGVIRLSDPSVPEKGCGFVILGMGKLGARELNYSSDIDLIVLYDLERAGCPDPDAARQEFVRLTRTLMRCIDERTADGYVFRTDLRLRPDPAATPLAISVGAAEDYYESMGQNWERAAMIKARPVAGDRDLGHDFLKNLRPYIWRKYLDFAAIEDIHSIKRQITAHRGGSRIAVEGHNIKVGRGGIREIEFFAQTQQLIWGGRIPEVREQQTVKALAALAAADRIDIEVVDELAQSYRFLRRVEHRLQMIDDSQTQELPANADKLHALALFLGYDDTESFRAEILAELATVERHYAGLFETSSDLGGGRALVFSGSDDHPDTVANLEEMGFLDGRTVSAIIRAWHHGRYRATRSERSRQILNELAPRLLQALAQTADPNAALIKFDEFLRGLPAGVQLFSTLAANPALIDLIAEIMGDAPRMADWLRRNPACLDAVLSSEFFDEMGDAATLRAELDEALTQAVDFQDVLDITRRWTNDHKFQVGVHTLRGQTEPVRAGPALSAVAECAIGALWTAVRDDFAEQHGVVPGHGMAVLALGKLGGREMTHRSDLDLVFVYEADPDATESNGPKPLPTSLYYTRLAQRLITAITAPTAEGRLYELDMRLRPSGNKGPLATSLQGYARYQEESAWTWENMALTRARVLLGPAPLRAHIEAVIQQTLCRPRDAAALAREVVDMRERIAKEHPERSPWDVKYRRGGLVDTEFIAQYLMLSHAARHPDVIRANTAEAYQALAEAGILDRAEAESLADAARFWRRLQGVLRMSHEGPFDESLATAGQCRTLIQVAGASNLEDLKMRMDVCAGRVREAFATILQVANDGAST